MSATARIELAGVQITCIDQKARIELAGVQVLSADQKARIELAGVSVNWKTAAVSGAQGLWLGVHF